VGGAAAVLATHFGLRARRLALVAPPISPERFARGFAKMLDLSDDVRDAMIARLERRYSLTMEELDARRHAARLDVPLLVVHDEGDAVVPHEDGASIAAAARAGRLVTTHGLGHRRVLRAPEVIHAVVPFVADGVRGTHASGTFARTLDGELFYREDRR
jgi:pimeloyl-ACP methyl ester carboxylesterase